MAERRMCTKQKITIAVSIVMLLAMLTAFFGSMQVDAATFIINNSECSLNADGSGWNDDNKVTVSCSATWTLDRKDSWIKLSKSSGGSGQTTFTITADKNYGSKRSGSVVITSLKDTRTINVTQYGNSISVDNDGPILNAGEGSVTIKASVTVGGVTWSTPNADWLTVSRSDGKIVISATENTTNAERIAKFNVMCSNNNKLSRTITVKQKPHYVTLDPGSYEFSAASDAKTVNVSTGAGSFEVSENISWLKVTKNSSSITLEADANKNSVYPRSGKITITSGRAQEIFTVTQKGNSLSISGNKYEPAAAGGKSYITVTVGSKDDYSATSNVDWIKCTKNGTELCIDVRPNPNNSVRTGKVKISSCGMFEDFVVEQDACALSVKLSGAEVDTTGQTATVKVAAAEDTLTIVPTTNYGSWNITTVGGSWLTVEKNSSNAVIKVAANTSQSARSGRIIVSAGNLSETYIVKQDGNTLTVGKSTYNPSAAGGKLSAGVSVGSKSEFYASCPAEWVTVTQTASSVEISVEPNPDAKERTATVTITSCGIFKTINITQDKNEIICDPVKDFDGPGGTKSVKVYSTSGLPLTTNSAPCLWANASLSEGVLTIKTDPNNTGKRRGGWINVYSGNVYKSVSFWQNPYTLTLGKDYFPGNDAGAKTYKVSVSTNCPEWTVSSANPRWITVTKLDEYSFMISMTMNDTGKARSGKVIVNAGGVTAEVNLSQSENIIKCNPSYFVTDSKGKILKAKIETRYGTWNVKSVSESWLHATKDTKSQLVISVTEKKHDENNKTREAKVVIESNGTILSIPVYQVDEMPAFVSLVTNGIGELPDDYSRWVFFDDYYPENCVPELSHRDYEFLGWYDEYGNKVDTSVKCQRRDNHTLYARWKNLKVDVEIYLYDRNNRYYACDVSTINANAMGRVHTVQYLDHTGDSISYFDSYTSTVYENFIIETNSPEKISIRENISWAEITCGATVEENGLYVCPITVKIDPFYTNLTSDPKKLKDGRGSSFTITVDGTEKIVTVAQHPFVSVDVDKNFYKNRYNIIATQASEKKEPGVLAGEWLYYEGDASVGGTDTHSFITACATADSSSSATFKSLKMSYSVSRDYANNIPLKFRIGGFAGAYELGLAGKIIEYRKGIDTTKYDYGIAQNYLGISDVKVSIKVKDSSLRIKDAYAFYTDDAENDRISGERRAVDEFFELIDAFMPNLPDFSSLSVFVRLVDDAVHKDQVFQAMKAERAAGRPVDDAAFEQARKERNEYVGLTIKKFADFAASIIPFDKILDKAKDAMGFDDWKIVNKINDYIDEFMEELKEEIDELFEKIPFAEKIFEFAEKNSEMEESIKETYDFSEYSNLDFWEDDDEDESLFNKTDEEIMREDAENLLDSVIEGIKEAISGEFEERIMSSEADGEARELGEAHDGNTVTYGGTVKYSDTWTHTVPKLATSISYFDIYLELCDSEGNPVAYDADDIEITCTGVIGGRRVNLLNPSEVNSD